MKIAYTARIISAVRKILDLKSEEGNSTHCLVNKVLKKKKRKTLKMPKANQINGRLFENDMSVTRNSKIKYTRMALAVKYSEMYFKSIK